MAGLHLVDLSRHQARRRAPINSPFRSPRSAHKWSVTLAAIALARHASPATFTLLALIAISVQTLFLAWLRARREPGGVSRSPSRPSFFWRTGWCGRASGQTRIALPLKLGFNVLLARHSPKGFWVWFALGSLDLVAAHHSLPIPGVPVLA